MFDDHPCFVRLKETKVPKAVWFCFHYLGGTANTFFPWSNLLPDEIMLYAAELPGRGQRSKEPFLVSVEDIVAEYANLFNQKSLPLPFVFFGHSMGALLAYEILARLSSFFSLSKGCLVVSACKPPHLIKYHSQSYELPDKLFIEKLKQYGGTPEAIIQDQELVKFFLPRLRADTELLENYQHQALRKLSIPILALGGTADKIVLSETLYHWQEYTDAEFKLKCYSGDHFYLKDAQAEIVDDIYKFASSH